MPGRMCRGMVRPPHSSVHCSSVQDKKIKRRAITSITSCTSNPYIHVQHLQHLYLLLLHHQRNHHRNHDLHHHFRYQFLLLSFGVVVVLSNSEYYPRSKVLKSARVVSHVFRSQAQ